MYESLYFVVPAIAFGAGYLVRNKSTQIAFEKKLAGVKAEAEKKLSDIKAEVEAIEQQADRRIVPAIHKVTARIRGLL